VLRDGEVVVSEAGGSETVTALRLRAVASIDPPCDGQPDQRVTPELARRLPRRITTPPLRDRREDIPGLARHLLQLQCAALGLPQKSASRYAIAVLAALPWRGNLHEMRGVVGALILKVPGQLIRLSDVLSAVRLDGTAAAFAGAGTLKQARERFERDYVAAILRQHHGRIADAAKALGVQRTNLYRKVRRLAVPRVGSHQ
jgi:two-component system nitrogen regulation response regulator NtrX